MRKERDVPPESNVEDNGCNEESLKTADQDCHEGRGGEEDGEVGRDGSTRGGLAGDQAEHDADTNTNHRCRQTRADLASRPEVRSWTGMKASCTTSRA